MSGTSLEITIDDSPLLRALDGLAVRAADLTPAMDAIGQAVINSTRDRFDAQVPPSGEPWRPSNMENKTIKKTL
ncbi:MAG: phage virion morphogenesis protein, partial [Magnetococcales bacterium]|nr:phage virion morphogenesis protein [Magnetococcales bacterium]